MHLPLGIVSIVVALSAFIAGSAFASNEGVSVPRPDQTKELLKVSGFQLKRTQFEPQTKVVIFFYSASYCVPCKQLAEQLEEMYPSLRTQHPELEFVTFGVDHSVSERAAYLRDSAFPWLAISPSALDDKEWQRLAPKTTPEFQAFELTEDALRVITSSGAPDAVLREVSAYLSASAG